MPYSYSTRNANAFGICALNDYLLLTYLLTYRVVLLYYWDRWNDSCDNQSDIGYAYAYLF